MLKKLSEIMTVKTTVTNHTIFRVLAITLAFILGVYFVYITRQALTLIGVSFFMAIALSPPVNALAKRMPHGSRGLATGLAYLATLSVLGLIIYSIIPPLVEQTQLLIQNLPAYIDNLEKGDNFIANFVQRFDLIESLRQSQQQLASQLSGAGGPVFDFLGRITSSIVSVLVVLVLTFFMLIEAPGWLEKFWAIQPKEKRKHRQALAQRMYRVVTGYVNGQLLIASMAAFATLVMLFILGVPFAVPLAAIVGVFGLIPLIGATLGSVIVVIVGLFQSVSTALVLLIFFVIYQQVENNVFQPVIQSKTIEMSPLLILIAAILGVSVAGILGALLAIPIAASVRVVILDYFERREKGLVHG